MRAVISRRRLKSVPADRSFYIICKYFAPISRRTVSSFILYARFFEDIIQDFALCNKCQYSKITKDFLYILHNYFHGLLTCFATMCAESCFPAMILRVRIFYRDVFCHDPPKICHISLLISTAFSARCVTILQPQSAFFCRIL